MAGRCLAGHGQARAREREVRAIERGKLVITTTGCLAALVSSAIAADKTAFEGTVSVMVTGASTEATQLLFTRKGNQLRIEDAARNKPEPVNLVDLASGKLTIISPHNSTFAQRRSCENARATGQTAAPSSPPPAPSRP